MSQRHKVIAVIGTRPEAIKMAPVIAALRDRDDRLITRVLVTAQHRELMDEVLALFHITPDDDLDVMTADQTQHHVAATIIARIAPVLAREQPDWVVVQGDTTTTLAVALAAFYAGVRVAHVEAGLRTYDRHNPFPEEMNRTLVSRLADLHFAPTTTAAQRLEREGIEPRSVLVTGNPVIDALFQVLGQHPDTAEARPPQEPAGVRTVLLTAHRRESFGPGLEHICQAVATICARYGDRVAIHFPVHPNPNVKAVAERLLGDVPQVQLLPPLPYSALVPLLRGAFLVLTDSGGLQEEAPSLGIPVLVLRDKTERIEAARAGTVQLVGTDPTRIVDAFSTLWTDAAAYEAMARTRNPYGDGRAAARIAAALCGETVVPFAADEPAEA